MGQVVPLRRGRRAIQTVGTPEEAVGALALMLGWNGGVLPMHVDDGQTRPKVHHRRCGRGATDWLLGGVRRFDGRQSLDVAVGLPETRPNVLGPSWSTVLWAWVSGKDQVWRAGQFRPLPSMVLRIDGGSKRLLLWFLHEAVPYPSVEPANRKIAYALRATQKWSKPELLRVPLPGTFVRVGRSRPAAVLVTRLEDRTWTRSQVVGRLKEPPSPDAWRDRRKAR